MLDLVQVEVVLVIVVGAFVAVQIVGKLCLQVTVSGFGPQQIPVLARIGTGPHRADGAVSQRNKGRRTGLHHQHKQDAGQSQQTAHGMAFHKTHRPGRQLFCGNSRFPGGLGSVFGRLLCLLLVSPAEPPLLPKPGQSVFGELLVLLGGGMKMIIRRSLNIPGLRLLNRLRRVFPDFPFHKPGAMPQGRLAHKLGAVGPFDAHILMLVFVNLPMHKAVGGAAGHPAHTPHRARLFGRLLFCQLFLCPIQLFPALFHAEFGCRRFLLVAFLPEF